MPTSNLLVWPSVLANVAQFKPKRVLDVGPGRGKASVLLREYIGEDLSVDAVEKHAPYVTERLKALYDIVFVNDVSEWGEFDFEDYDVVLMADVIEHIKKDDAISLLQRIGPPVVISTPRDFFVSVPGHPTEEHISHWVPQDFESAGRVIISNDAEMWNLGGVIVSLAPLESWRGGKEYRKWMKRISSREN